MCRHFMEDYGIQVRVARYHNIYGPYGTYDGGREKAPAALCRKVLNAKRNNDNKIQVWGDEAGSTECTQAVSSVIVSVDV